MHRMTQSNHPGAGSVNASRLSVLIWSADETDYLRVADHPSGIRT
jgi:hypothetical protein